MIIRDNQELYVWNKILLSSNILHQDKLASHKVTRRIFLAWHYSWEGGSPLRVDFSGNFHIFTPILDSAERRRRVESSKCLVGSCLPLLTFVPVVELSSDRLGPLPGQAGLVAWSQRKILDFCSEEIQRQGRKHVMIVIMTPIMMIIITMNKLWCKQSDTSHTRTTKTLKNFHFLWITVIQAKYRDRTLG